MIAIYFFNDVQVASRKEPLMTRTRSERRKDRGKTKEKAPRRAAGGKGLAAAILALGIVASIAVWQWPGSLWGYKKAPSFTLLSSTGRPVSLEDFRGKKEVVLIFYMGTG